MLPSFSGQRWLLDSIADVVAAMMFSRAVLVSQEGVNFGNTTGLVVVDTTPHVGNFLEGYLSMHQTSNVATHYVPIFADESHQEWFEAFWLAEMGKLFQKGELKVPNMEKLLAKCRQA